MKIDLKELGKRIKLIRKGAGSYARNVSRESWCQPALYL